MSLCHECLGNDKQTGRILVNPMNKPHLRVIRVKIGILPKMPCHSIYQCSMSIAATRMHDHSCRLVHNHEVIILIYNFQRDIFGNNAAVIDPGVQCYDNDIAWFYLVIALYNLAIDRYGAGIGSLLYLVAGCIGYMVYKKLVYSDRRLPFIYYNTDFPEKALLFHIQFIILDDDIVHFITILKQCHSHSK